MKNLLKLLLSLSFFFLAQTSAFAQSSSWSKCTDDRLIARCETYDCPRGDTNNDGRCSLTDTDARLTDARNDSFCANPISGCGQVQYYPGGANDACLVRVEELPQNCDLYAVANPSFTPSPTPAATSTPRATSTPTATPSITPVRGGDGGGDSELPKTGSEEIWIGAFVLILGAAGVFLYEKYKIA